MENILMLQVVAKVLSPLKNQLLYVGGAVAELYADQPELSDIRPTKDVDCVVELTTLPAYNKLEAEIRKLGFTNDTSHGAPMFRYLYHNIIVDLMPMDSTILGFTNRWYLAGAAKKEQYTLSNKQTINILPPEYYIATKFEAHNTRGGNDLRQSHDFEDIIYVLDNCSTLFKNKWDSELSDYLSEQAKLTAQNPAFLEALEAAMPIGTQLERIRYLQEIVNTITRR